MTTGRTVFIEFIAKTQNLLSGFRKAEKKTNSLTRAFRRAGLALAGVFGARAVFRGFQQTLRQSDDLIKTAKGVGFLAKEYQQLTFALGQVGVGAESARIALGDFQKRVAKPGFAKFFREAGLNPRDLQRMGDAEAFNTALATLAAQVDNPRIAGLTGNVFEEQSGKDILKVIRQWEKYLAAREKFSRRVGGMTREQQNSIESLSEEIKLYGAQWDVIKMRVVGDIAPELLKSLKKLDEANVFENMAKAIGATVDGMLKLSTAYAEFVDHAEESTARAAAEDVSRAAHGDATPYEEAVREGYVNKWKNLFPTGPGKNPVTPTRINNYIDTVINGVKDKDMARKTEDAVVDGVSRGMVRE